MLHEWNRHGQGPTTIVIVLLLSRERVSELSDARLMTVEAVAARLGVKPATIRSYRWRGILPEPHYIGRTPVWSVDAIETWIQQRPGRGRGGGRKRQQHGKGANTAGGCGE